MAKLKWDETGKRLYETGTDRGVIWVANTDGTFGNGEAWNGLRQVTEQPSGAEANALWADNIKYLNLISTEEYGATIGAYTYPDSFKECNGEKEIATGVTIGQQTRKLFCFSWRTLLGNDVLGTDYGYKIHIVYNATASPSEKDYQTTNDSPEAIEPSWEISTTPVNVTGGKPTACVTIDSTKVDKDKLKALEDKLYGTEDAESTLLLPDEIAELVGTAG